MAIADATDQQRLGQDRFPIGMFSEINDEEVVAKAVHLHERQPTGSAGTAGSLLRLRRIVGRTGRSGHRRGSHRTRSRGRSCRHRRRRFGRPQTWYRWRSGWFRLRRDRSSRQSTGFGTAAGLAAGTGAFAGLAAAGFAAAGFATGAGTPVAGLAAVGAAGGVAVTVSLGAPGWAGATPGAVEAALGTPAPQLARRSIRTTIRWQPPQQQPRLSAFFQRLLLRRFSSAARFSTCCFQRIFGLFLRALFVGFFLGR